ncbi:MAG: hypothetical protein RLY97_458 [Pseudomonadota bacterium]|jgi:isoquinoline 1-oxidoreductase subunit alpha
MVALTVNAQPLDFAMDPQTPLLWVLREGANLTGTKFGCGAGDCGACMVLVDGAAQPSCQISLAQAEGAEVTTIEGLTTQLGGAIQRALASEGAVQCGFCTPGIAISAAALLMQNTRPDEAAIKAAIPNICRCGVYPRLVRAVQKAGAEIPEPPMPPKPIAFIPPPISNVY